MVMLERLTVVAGAVLLGLAVGYAWLAGGLGLPRAFAQHVYNMGLLAGWGTALAAMVLALVGWRRSAKCALGATGAVTVLLWLFLIVLEPILEAQARQSHQLGVQRVAMQNAVVSLDCSDGFSVHLFNNYYGGWEIMLLREGDIEVPNRTLASFLSGSPGQCKTLINTSFLEQHRELLASCTNDAGIDVDALIARINTKACP
jgi:hypothetical protein